MIKFLQIEPDLGGLEASYRRAFLKSDASQAIFVMGLSNLASLALIRSDYSSHGAGTEFFQFLTARLGVFLISCLAIFILAKSPQPKQHDWAVASYMAAGALINIFINSITPPSYVAYIGVSIVVLNIHYFALYTSLPARTLISYFFSAVVVFQAHQFHLSQELETLVLGMHLLTNIIGTAISAKLYTHRRISFKAQMEERDLQKKLNRLANTDPLTNTSNRRRFTEEALEEFERARRYKRPLSLLLIDIDHLKGVNDKYGHLNGDEAILHCVRMMNAQIRSQDVLGRLGGDEFGILLPETQLSDGIIVGKRIQDSSREKTVTLNGEDKHITFSIGVTELNDDDASYDEFFGRADKLLYCAKESGRDKLVSGASNPCAASREG